ncbi:MAG: S1/P1 nuclease [Alistipes sp.]|nr:S1/P1 nuclease [Alistipes sp.]
MRKFVVILMAAILLPQFAMGWGRLGHRTIAEIAERNLTPKAKANIEKYTGGTPLWKYSLWVDEMRNHPDYKKPLYGLHASIADSDCTSPQIVRDRYRDGKDGVTAMYTFREQLKNYKELPDSVVLYAIKCITHIVADFNCPSHVRYVDNANKGDYPAIFNGKKVGVHRFWDTWLIESLQKDRNPQHYADRLNVLSKKEIKKITKGWAQEWFEDAARSCRPTLYWVDNLKIEKLDQKFIDKATPLVESQLQKAGYQMAEALNTIFGK